MPMHEELVKRMRNCTSDTVEDCAGCPYQGGYKGTYCMNGLISEAADAIVRLQAFNAMWQCAAEMAHENEMKWIPVTERLPEKDTRVIVCASLPEGVHSDFIYEDGHWFVSIGVTHWMPLPAPPKE